jgi:hypothetical protein
MLSLFVQKESVQVNKGISEMDFGDGTIWNIIKE